MVGFGPELAELADSILIWGDSEFLVHTQILASRSQTLAHLISATDSDNFREREGKSLREINLNVGAPEWVIAAGERRVVFLRHIYWGDAVEIESFEEAADVIKLADFFVAASVVRRAEGWLSRKALQLLATADQDGGDHLCSAFELGVKHRLTLLTSMLLPWALQRLNCGPLASPAWSVWQDAQARLQRLQTAMGQDLKSLCMEAHWWSCGMPQRCPTCGCRSGDLALAINPFRTSIGGPQCTTGNGFAAAGGSSTSANTSCMPSLRFRLPDHYLASAAHLSHILVEANWGCTAAIQSGVMMHS